MIGAVLVALTIEKGWLNLILQRKTKIIDWLIELPSCFLRMLKLFQSR